MLKQPRSGTMCVKEEITEPNKSRIAMRKFIVPIIQVEIRIRDDINEICTIYEGQTAEQVAEQVANKYKLDREAKQTMCVELDKYLKSLAGL